MNKVKYGVMICLFIGISAVLGACHPEEGKEDTVGEQETYTKLKVITMGSYGSADTFEEVKEEINKITREKLGVEVDLQVIGSDYTNAVELLLTSGEQVDVLCGSNTLFMKMYINKQLCNLEPLLDEYGHDIVTAVGRENINCCRIGGVLYGLPNNRDYAAGWDSYALRKDILDKYGIKKEDIHTIEELEKVFDLILEREPDMVPLACSGSLFGNFALADGINSFPAGGHTNYGQDKEIVNIFETDEYMDRLKRVRHWYLKGYMGKNVLENTSGVVSMVKEGKAFAEAVKNKPGIEVQESLKCGREMAVVQFGETAISYNSMAAYPWMITKNTVSKEKSMELLNLFYSNADIMNLLSYGIEGKDYVKTDDGHICLPEGKDSNPYYSMAWTVPNQFITYVWEGNPLNLWDQMREWNNNALKSCEIGFNFNVFPVAKQYMALEEIYSNYKPVLESGLVNPEQGLEKMLKELRENGLDEVIGEKRKQFENFKKTREK